MEKTSATIVKSDIEKVVENILAKAPKVDTDKILPGYGQDDKSVHEILKFDSLATAEKVTGVSYKGNEPTEALGFLLTIEHGRKKAELLSSMDDTTFSNKLDNYLRIAKDIGFEIVLEVPFTYNPEYDTVVREEKYFILMHRKNGILLSFDTYFTDSVNGGNFYYCWEPKDPKSDYFQVLSSRSMISKSGDPDWRKTKWEEIDQSTLAYFGYHDCREALRFNIRQLEKAGNFLPVWPKNDEFLWLLHYGDTKVEGYNHKAITKKRIEMLPDWARKILNRQ